MHNYKFIPYNKNLVTVARDLRKNQTEAEIKFFDMIKNHEIFKHYKFTSQKPIDNFIVDFYCSELLLAIEIDGEIHNFQKERDEERDNILSQKYGLQVLRFTNQEVLSDPDRVFEKLENIKLPSSFIKGN